MVALAPSTLHSYLHSMPAPPIFQAVSSQLGMAARPRRRPAPHHPNPSSRLSAADNNNNKKRTGEGVGAVHGGDGILGALLVAVENKAAAAGLAGVEVCE